ncbi:EF-hand calcium-binding domain-containing protein 4B isoform X1 [Helicoverpa zea]|uniref:EF-hand calcium-binding domain-containing protein 4B isoform X1 n=1 Tax=Helicoverpa zea TaxID=7113 RepID=UPI001F596382|nr:EF-hand calcium-binding domain-containing protein 4B isoform X1 [Helicoverpa zea]
MRDEEPPLPPPSPGAARSAPSRLRRTLHTLRTPFRPGSPFHIGLIKRTGSSKSVASDGEIGRDERTMRKRNKKNRDAVSDASRSTDSSPGVDKKKKEGSTFMRRMGSFGKKRAGESPQPPSETQPSTSEKSEPPVEHPLSQPSEPEQPTPEPVQPTPEPVQPTPEPVQSTPEPEQPTPEPVQSTPEPVKPTPEPEQPNPEPVSPIAVEHPVAIRPFSKAAWKRNSEPEMEKPVEDPSPESALRRRIAFVAQASAYLSEEHEDGERGGAEVGSLEEAVALARVRLAVPAPPSPALSRDTDTEEEGYSDAMPAYGDLIEPDGSAGSDGAASHASPSAERREHLYKILVIGELGTGKTSIIKRYVHQFFSQHYRATIGVDFALKVLNWDANTIIRLQLWDIAGQERFGNMTRVYYKEAVGAFIVFDVSRVATFDAVVKWKNDLDAKVQLPDGSPIPCILLANKCDQQKEGIVNSQAKMEEYCREKGFAGWFETSAKENINIEEAARSLVNKILLNDKLLQSNDNRDGDKFALDHKIANGENSRDGTTKSCSC